MMICGFEIFLALASLFFFVYGSVQKRRRAVPPIYPVFLSGPETQTGVIDFLFQELKNGRVRVFSGEEAIPRGKDIWSERLWAIGTCTIAIPIISEQYARSKWYLRELTEIMYNHEKRKISVFPVFYEVDVDDVKYQRGSFKEDLSKLEKEHGSEQVDEWRRALTFVANIRGRILRPTDPRSDAVEMIHGRVSSELRRRWIERLPVFIRSVYIHFSKKSKCQVFLAFNDPRVQTGLATDICAGLMAEKIKVFYHDDPSLIGTNVADSIWNAIHECQIYIPIFSERCTSCHWFREGLIHKIENETERRNIWPIYYKVSPSQVQNELCDIQNPMFTHENGKLASFMNIKGWALKEETGNEANLVREVVRGVLTLLNNPYTGSQTMRSSTSTEYRLPVHFSKKSECQVFLAFNDPRVQTGLAAFICAGLMAENIKVFYHGGPSLTGTNVAGSIWNVIHKCQIYIPIFSERCTSCHWFREGLIHKIENETERRNILPIYYKVSPSQVQNELCDIQNPMFTHDNGKLASFMNIKGWVLEEETGNEANLVREVVQGVLTLLNSPYTGSQTMTSSTSTEYRLNRF